MANKANNNAAVLATAAALAANGNGNNTTPATNAAPYTGKYTAAIAKLGAGNVPAFKYAGLHIYCNPAANTAPQKSTTVMGKLYAHVKANPGLTGNALVLAMLNKPATFWVGHPTKYVGAGLVCPHWVVGYVNGLFAKKHMHCVTGPAPKGNA
jgi:hypothetical protein